MATSLINRAAIKRYILDNAERLRPGWECSRVSKDSLDDIESHLRAHIRGLVRNHPSGCGKTFKP